jgi:mono/diheme cytochrome c family protein
MLKSDWIARIGLAGMVGLAALAIVASSVSPTSAGDVATTEREQEILHRGRYLVRVAGCNDCHTPNYMVDPEAVVEDDWLIGVPVGWLGPWGTTYAANLRLSVHEFPEDVWIQMLRTRKANPPMPWINVSFLTDGDAQAMYRYIKSLGPKGERMPAPLPPGEMPTTPYFDFNIKGLPEGDTN